MPALFFILTRKYCVLSGSTLTSDFIGCPILGFISTSREIHSLLGGMQVSMMRAFTGLPCSSCDSFLTVRVPCSCYISSILGCGGRLGLAGM